MSSKKLRIKFLDRHPPFSYYDPKTKQYKGIFADAWQAIASNLRLDYEYTLSGEYEETEDIID